MARPAKAQVRVEKEYRKSIGELMQEMYADKNMHSSDIAKQLKVTPSTIVRWCHDNGIPVKPRGGRIDVPTSKYPKIINLYESGKTSTEIADKFNCTGCTISKILKDSNVEIRGYRERFVRKHTLDERYFKEIDSPMKAYFLGWAMSDGCVTYDVANGCRYRLKIKSDDAEILEKFKNELKYDAPIGIDSGGKRKYSAKFVAVYSVVFVEDLISHGVIPNKSTIMTVPMDLPYELEGHFIRGYFDGDGCVTLAHKDTNLLKIEYCGNITMMRWIAESIKNHTGISENKICARNSYFAALSYSCSKVSVIRDFMYPEGIEFGLKRKKDLLFTAMDEFPIVDCVKELMNNISIWEGTATELYGLITVIANRNKVNKSNVPGSASSLSRVLRQHELELNESNIISKYRKLPGGIRRITLKRF